MFKWFLVQIIPLELLFPTILVIITFLKNIHTYIRNKQVKRMTTSIKVKKIMGQTDKICYIADVQLS